MLLRCDHPRTSHVLTDRPDHWLEVGVDFQTGMILLLAEHIGGQITRHGEVTSLTSTRPIPDSAFSLHISDDTVTLYYAALNDVRAVSAEDGPAVKQPDRARAQCRTRRCSSAGEHVDAADGQTFDVFNPATG